MILIIVSFLAGILSVLAPCVLPVIPVIFSWTLSWKGNSQVWRVIFSMMISIVLFTFLLKASTLFINIDQSFRTTISSVIIIWYGFILIFPSIREKISLWLRLDRTYQLSEAASEKKGFWWDVLLWASLGPIFSTCSPTYALLLSTVLPINLSLWIICMIVYSIGFGWFLFVLVNGGKSLIKKFYWVSDNNSVLKKVLGVILLIIWGLIMTGYMLKLEIAFTQLVPDIWKVEQQIIKKTKAINSATTYNKKDGLLRPESRLIPIVQVRMDYHAMKADLIPIRARNDSLKWKSLIVAKEV